MENANNVDYLEKIKKQVIENLKRTTFAPSVQMTDVPRDPDGMDDEADAILDDRDEDENMDQRHTKRRWDKYVEKEGELSESEDEEENQRNGIRRQNHTQKRRNIMDYQNPNAVSDDEKAVNRTRKGSHESAASGSRPAAVTNGSVQYEDGTPSPAASRPQSQGSAGAEDTTMQDADFEMEDEPSQSAATANHFAAEGPQEVTPPESPIPAAPATASTAQPNADQHDDLMDEVAGNENPETAQKDGLRERDQEDVTAERDAEVAEEQEKT